MPIKSNRLLLYLFLFLVAFIFLLPLLIMIQTSFRELSDIKANGLVSLARSFSFVPWVKAWESACIGIDCKGISPFFLNSLKFCIPAVFFSTLLGAYNGLVLTKYSFKYSDHLFFFMLVGLFIPLQSIIIPLARLLHFLNLQNTVWGLILVHTVYGLSFTTLYFRNYYATFPKEIIQAAKMDGASFFQLFIKIVLPLSVPMLMVTIVWQFTNIWNDYLFGVILTSGDERPITVALYNLVSSTTSVKHYNIDMAASLLSAIPTLLVYLLAGKYFIRGITQGSVK